LFLLPSRRSSLPRLCLFARRGGSLKQRWLRSNAHAALFVAHSCITPQLSADCNFGKAVFCQQTARKSKKWQWKDYCRQRVPASAMKIQHNIQFDLLSTTRAHTSAPTPNRGQPFSTVTRWFVFITDLMISSSSIGRSDRRLITSASTPRCSSSLAASRHRPTIREWATMVTCLPRRCTVAQTDIATNYVQLRQPTEDVPSSFKLCRQVSQLSSLHHLLHHVKCLWHWHSNQYILELEMWANTQRDGRPAEYRWHPLFNAAKFGWCPILEYREVTLPQTNEMISAASKPKFTIL